MESFDVVIVGAGLSGLTLANHLKNHLKVLVLEKSKGLGGRLATRRIEGHRYDHGLLYFSLVPPSLSQQLQQVWTSPPLFSHPQGMTKIAKDLAEDLNVKTEQKLSTIHIKDNGLFLETESGQPFFAKKLVMTAPLPQSLELLERNQLPFPAEFKEVKYTKCLVLLAQLSAHDQIEYLQPEQGGIATISHNAHKGLSEQGHFTIQMKPDFSHEHYLKTHEEIQELILNELSRVMNFHHNSSQVKKWKYAQVQKALPQKYYWDDTRNIGLIGDSFQYEGVIGALQSAESLATALIT